MHDTQIQTRHPPPKKSQHWEEEVAQSPTPKQEAILQLTPAREGKISLLQQSVGEMDISTILQGRPYS